MYNPFIFKEPEKKKTFILEPAEKNIKPARQYIIGRDLSENEKYPSQSSFFGLGKIIIYLLKNVFLKT